MLKEYTGVLIFMVISIVLGIVVEVLSYWLGNTVKDSEKLTVFECGFDAFENSRSEFEVNFYMVALLFIVFDIEASYLLPFIVNMDSLGSVGIYGIVDFIIELLIGLLYVLQVGVLDSKSCES